MTEVASAPVIKTNLLGLDQDGLKQFFAALGEKPYRAVQVLKWIHHHGVDDIDQMTDLGKKLRDKLKAIADIRAPKIVTSQMASDGTGKFLLELDSGNKVEAVFIPDKGRGTLCVSSQVGCALDCSFCSTARQGFNRNMSAAEIVGQVWLTRHRLLQQDEFLGMRLTNVVMMGMGEPLLNFSELVPSLNLMMDDLAYGLSKRKVTVSTSGILPAMDRLKEAVDVSLAVSLHAPTDALRDELVPINKKYPIAELMQTCRRYVQKDHKAHIMFEYVMLAGVNDGVEHAKALARLLRGLPAKVNLIPFNPFPGSGYVCSSDEAIDQFWQVLTDRGIRTTKRRTRGDDIDAACGQLAGRVQDRSRRERRFAQPRFGER